MELKKFVPTVINVAGSIALVVLLGLEAAFSLLFVDSGPQGEHGAMWTLSRLSDGLCCGMLIICFVRRRPAILSEQSVIRNILAVAAFLSPLMIIGLPPRQAPPQLILLSSSIFLIGSFMTIATAFHLGRSFSILPQARQLVTSGPYKFVRHPMYLAEIITIAGTLWRSGQPYSSFVVFAVVALQLLRIQYEEDVLVKAFPDYEDYRSRTPKLIPAFKRPGQRDAHS